MDGFIAATALEHNLTIVTRNVKDFAGLRVTVFNPWGRRTKTVQSVVASVAIADGLPALIAGEGKRAMRRNAEVRSVYFNDARTFTPYSSALSRICFSSRVSIRASRTTGLPLTITSRTSAALSA